MIRILAARWPLHGQDHVTRFAQDIFRIRPADMQVTVTEINGAQLLLIWVAGAIYRVMNFRIAEGWIRCIHTVLNLDKLSHLLPHPLPAGAIDWRVGVGRLGVIGASRVVLRTRRLAQRVSGDYWRQGNGRND